MDRQELTDMANAWWAAVSEASFVSMPPREAQALLGAWIEELEAALSSEPFDPTPAAQVGAEMVRTNFTNPATMTPSATVLSRLLERSALPDRARRFGAVMGELGRGYTSELLAARSRSQEALHLAMTEARQAVEARFRVVFDNAAVAIAVYDTNGIMIDANPTQARMVGMDRKDMRGVFGLEFIHPDDRDKFTQAVLPMIESGGGTVRFEGRYCRRDGTVGWGAWAITLVPGEGEHDAYMLAIGEDTTERRTMQAELRWQARHDPLTGLANRRFLLERLDAIIAEARPSDRVGLCFVDLDAFKLVNDRYGHGAGDRLLAEVARRLSAAMSSSAVTLARIGGDEFVALLAPPCDDDAVSAAAEAMLAALREPVQVGPDDLLSMSASIGAVVTAVTGADAEALLDEADTGLYRAKADGRGTWVLQQASEPRTPEH
jgi:diguanylate cyclase (GGDEF)-like protein/PAS domain S-box-containing protein